MSVVPVGMRVWVGLVLISVVEIGGCSAVEVRVVSDVVWIVGVVVVESWVVLGIVIVVVVDVLGFGSLVVSIECLVVGK